MKKEIFVGVDVSKQYLDIYTSSGTKYRKRNTLSECQKLSTQLKQEAVLLVVVEATGGYEDKLVEALQSVEVSVAVVNPRHTHSFSKSLGKKAKTDILDAEMLCLYAERMKPMPTAPTSAEQKELQSLVLRREQLVTTLSAEKNRLKSPKTNPAIEASLSKTISFLKGEIRQLDQLIKNNISSNDDFAKKDKILQDAKGVGKTLSATLIALLPELGNINRKQVAALVGVAPFNNDSGQVTGKRSIYGGRTHVRSVLYMATIAAIRCNPCIRNFYLRLVQQGKASKVAITACMRKLLVALNAMVRDSATWSDARHLSQK